MQNNFGKNLVETPKYDVSTGNFTVHQSFESNPTIFFVIKSFIITI